MTQAELDAKVGKARDMLERKIRRAGRMGINVTASCAQFHLALEVIDLQRAALGKTK